MAYKFQLGAATLSGSTTFEESVNAESLVIEDGKTIGVSSVKDLMTITSDGDLTFKDGTHDFDIASHDGTNGLKLAGTIVTSDAGELNLVDGASAGTVVNSKAVIYGGAGQVNGTTVSSSAGLAGASVAVDGNISAGQLSSSANLLVGGTVQLDGVAEISGFARGADSLFFRDGDDNLMKATNMADFFGEIGGNGLTENDNRLIVDVSGAMTIDSTKLGITGSIAGNGITFAGGASSISSLAIDLATDSGLNSGAGAGGDQLTLSFADLGNETVAVADDFIAFMDSGSANQPTKRVTIADFVSGIAGAGLTAASGQLSTAGNSVALKADGDTLATGVNYFASASANATVSLPGSPTVGDRVVAKAAELGDGSKVIIQRQGSHVIDDDQTQIEIESPFGAVTLVYVVANEWRII